MKVIHLVTDDIGGAGRAARRISDALNTVGIESLVLVLEQYNPKSNVLKIVTNKGKITLFKCLRKLYQQINRKNYHVKLFSEPGYGLDLAKLKQIQSADIIHLHWVNYGMISKKGLKSILRNKYVVWTLHDMWPFTAGCYYDGECGRYKNGCKECPLIVENRRSKITARAWNSKKAIYERAKNLTFVGCSHWITNCAQHSELTGRFRHSIIPNPIDIDIFINKNASELKKSLKIPEENKVILYGAMTSDSDTRKGYRYLKDSLKGLKNKNCTALVFGNNKTIEEELDIPVIGLGMISDDGFLAQVYSIADVFVAPSVQENLSNAVMESLSCATPVVAFNIGGMSDMLRHKYNGYLAKPFEAQDLLKGIEYCLEHPEMRDQSRKYVEKKFSMNTVGKQYLELYESLMEKS